MMLVVTLAGCDLVGGASSTNATTSVGAPTTVAPATSAASSDPTTSAESATAQAGGCPTGPEFTGCRIGVVTYIVDGDTIQLANGPQIRFLGMDTPERGQCDYQAATARVEELVGDKTVTVVHVVGNTTDKYHRELGYIEIGGVDLGRLLIAEGYAHARYDSLDGYPHHPRQDDYRALDAATTNRCGTAPRTTNPRSSTSGSPSVPAATSAELGSTTTTDMLCNRAYSPCLPVTNDMNCPKIGTRVRVLEPGVDPYHLDADGDGIGCQSYPEPPGR
jgi:endonuclease YncB( thermonuclease family)